MSLPKTLSDSLIARLNSACDAFQGCCDLQCDKIGWCDACWIAVGGVHDMSAEPRDKYERDIRVQQPNIIIEN